MNARIVHASLAAALIVSVGCTSDEGSTGRVPSSGPAAEESTANAERRAPAGDADLVDAGCWPTATPVGALPDQPPPVFCSIAEEGADTAQPGDNTWIDDFDHGQSFADLDGDPYVVFDDVGFVHDTVHWRHADHWMVDVAAHAPDAPERWVRGGAMLRPDQTFRFEDGVLVVEADAAAAIDRYAMHAWPELVVSTGSQPHDVGSLYAYDMFPEDWTVGCRLQDSRYPVCALKSDDGDTAAGEPSGRPWEMSAHQAVGDVRSGGAPFGGLGERWRTCGEADPDDVCRDRFRLELAEDRLTLFVNGEKYFEQAGTRLLPDELLTGDVYVYFASMVVSHPAETVRFHWDRLAVNPETPPGPAPGFEV
jgi:hypothetical protein